MGAGQETSGAVSVMDETGDGRADLSVAFRTELPNCLRVRYKVCELGAKKHAADDLPSLLATKYGMCHCRVFVRHRCNC